MLKAGLIELAAGCVFVALGLLTMRIENREKWKLTDSAKEK